MLDRLKTKAANTAKRAGLLTGGLLAIVVGLGFLTAAGWIYLVNVTDTLTAALILGGAFTGAGSLTVGMASTSGSSHDTQPTSYASQPSVHEAADHPPLMQAFLHGMQAGVSATQARR